MDLFEIKNFSDSNGNTIKSEKSFSNKIKIIFKGKNNRLEIDKEALIDSATIKFSGNNGFIKIGRAHAKKGLALNIRVGEDSSVILGDGLTVEKNALFFAAEGAKISVGKDCMFASHVQVRADDSHPTFDVTSGLRTNTSKDITIGDHCWIGFQAVLLKGTHIKNGCCVGMHSLVTGHFPNNCTIAGTPAKIIKINTIWERPHLADTQPPYKPDKHSIKISKAFWDMTDIQDIPELYLKKLWEDKDSKKIISYCKTLEKLVPSSYYFNGLALYHEKLYSDSLQEFIKYLKTNDIEFRTKVYYCIANTFIRLKHFTNAYIYAQQAYVNAPLNTDYISALLLLKTINNHPDTDCFIDEIRLLLPSKEFLTVILTSANRLFYINEEKFSTLASRLYKYICSLKYVEKENSDTCYIIIQPLLNHNYLFANRKFGCSVLFLKIENDYTYFMPFLDDLLDKIISILKNRYKNITILSTSAGAFLSLVIGGILYAKCENINIKVYAFSPQTNINNNANLRHVTHYKRMQAFKNRYSFIQKYIEKYGDINKFYTDTQKICVINNSSLSATIIFGEKALVDVIEAHHVEKAPFITLLPLKDFPFQASLKIFRYSEKELPNVYPTFEALTPDDNELQQTYISEYSSNDCVLLKHNNHYELKKLLPYME